MYSGDHHHRKTITMPRNNENQKLKEENGKLQEHLKLEKQKNNKME